MKLKKKIEKGMAISLLILLFIACQKQDTMVDPSTNGTQQVITSLSSKPIETLCKDFFSENPSLVDYSKIIIRVTNEFLGINRNYKEFQGKKTCKIQPIYAYGIDGVAYYEVWFTENNITPKGWILISVTDKDYPLVNFSHVGQPYSYQVMRDALNKQIPFDGKNKIYRFGPSYFTLEGADGNKLAEHGKMPEYIMGNVPLELSGSYDSKNGEKTKEENLELINGTHYYSIDSYESLKMLYAQHYYTQSKADFAKIMKKEIFPEQGHGNAYYSKDYIYRWVSGQTCYYTQIPPNYGYNNTSCYSGCNNNAWVSIFGWWDINQSKSNLIPTTSEGEECPLYRITQPQMDVVDPIEMYLRNVCGTFCIDDQGCTLSGAYKAYQYPESKGYGTSRSYYYSIIAGYSVKLANILTDCIANNGKPASVGANSHYYVGLGWAQMAGDTQQTWAYCYPGWQTNDNDNVWIIWKDMNYTIRLFIY